jgi:hypothetical protein
MWQWDRPSTAGPRKRAIVAALAQWRSADGKDCQIEGNGAFNHGYGYIAAAHEKIAIGGTIPSEH